MDKYVTLKHGEPDNRSWVVYYKGKQFGRILIQSFAKRNEATVFARRCNNHEEGCGLEYCLRWWSCKSDRLVGQENVKFTPQEIQKLLELPAEEPPIYCYFITASHRQRVGKGLKHKIDLNKYEYTLETR